jgi:two-component system cell cycle sensor histidine kinase PleC
MSQPPSLTKIFAAIGGAIFLLAAAALGYMNWTRSVSQLTALGEDYNATLAAALRNATRDELEPLLRAAVAMDGEDVRRDPRPRALREVVLGLAEGTRVAKVKIYSASGLTVFSSNPGQIGAEKGLYPRLRAALAGQTMSEIEYGEDFVDFAGNRVEADLLSSYLPVRAADGRVIGVFEVYTDVSDLNAEISATEVFNLAILVLCFGAIYGLLLTTVAAGNRAIARKHQENLELAAAMARAQAADRAKSEFLANMSHELRTPLNAIIGFSEIIKDESFGPIGPNRYRDYAVDIHESGQRLLAIINNVLDLVKIEAGAAQTTLSEVDPAQLIDAAVARIRDQAKAAEVNLTLRMAQELPSISTDSRRLNQVLTGILSNAIKFTPQGGRVSVRARWNQETDRVEISVSDTGIGIAPADIPVTLAPFGRVDAAANSKYPGAGLGLPLAKRFTELLGGEIEIQSRLGQGTEIIVRLPRKGRDRPDTPKRAAA